MVGVLREGQRRQEEGVDRGQLQQRGVWRRCSQDREVVRDDVVTEDEARAVGHLLEPREACIELLVRDRFEVLAGVRSQSAYLDDPLGFALVCGHGLEVEDQAFRLQGG